VLEWLAGGEPARARLTELLESERPVMSWINLGEVAYVLRRRVGPEPADEVVARLRGRLVLDEPGPERVLAAAAIKADHPIAFADAFALATAEAYGCTLLTGDPEILASPADWSVEDLRPSRRG
jgi:predicted nucleic acid-binding protein